MFTRKDQLIDFYPAMKITQLQEGRTQTPLWPAVWGVWVFGEVAVSLQLKQQIKVGFQREKGIALLKRFKGIVSVLFVF